MHAPGERERARLQKGVWWQLRNSSRLKERTVWEVRKRRERMRGARGFIGERERVRGRGRTLKLSALREGLAQL